MCFKNDDFVKTKYLDFLDLYTLMQKIGAPQFTHFVENGYRQTWTFYDYKFIVSQYHV